jgi:hypothetical protein
MSGVLFTNVALASGQLQANTSYCSCTHGEARRKAQNGPQGPSVDCGRFGAWLWAIHRRIEAIRAQNEAQGIRL